MTRLRAASCLIFFSILFAACRTPASSPISEPDVPVSRRAGALQTIAPTSPREVDPTESSAGQEPTQVVIISEDGVAAGEAPPAPTAAPDPLRFTFPTPAPAPVSAWRPPLYSIPWAPSPYDHFYFSRPTAADEVNWPIWNYRYGGSFFENVVHTGIDIPAPIGTPVLAAGSGKVIAAGYGIYRGYSDPTDPYGLAVAIQHDFGYGDQALFTIYGHLSQVDVADGQQVDTGDQLGLVGETGKVTGPHLHFEVRVGENDYFASRNPELWLVPPQGWGVLAGRVTNSGGQLVNDQMVIITSKSSGQNWLAKSYGLTSINSDPNYRENLVISDLPSGIYELRIPYVGVDYRIEIEVQPGVVNYFTFNGHQGFRDFTPPTPSTADLNLEEANLSAP